MNRPNLLATKRGRLITFFFLYLTEGIPLGFVATAVAPQLRRQGVGPAEIGAFIASFYLPWSFKFVAGPVVDVFSSDRWGRRRMWIVGAQSLMVLTLLATVGVHLPGQLKLFTVLLLIHNIFAAAYLGQAVGGSAVLYLMKTIGLAGSTVFVSAVIASVTLLVALPIREPVLPRAPRDGNGLHAVGRELGGFLRDAVKSMFGSRPAFVGLIFALLPGGGMALGLALQANLAVEIGLNDNAIATLSLWSTILSAAFCVIGGQLSDKLGRRRMLALYFTLMAVPTLYLALVLKQNGWIMPVDVEAVDRPLAPQAVITAFWIAVLVYSVFQGLMYGSRTALFMDVTNPAVAATQFTAYMALMNLTISYSAAWQGWWIERFGYPGTLLVDALFGLVCIATLPLMGPRRKRPPAPEVPQGFGAP
jgi:MFS family permease